MSLLLDVLSWVLLLSGGLLSIVSAFGVLRLPELFQRMHSATILDTLGAGLVLSGLILQAGFTVISFKLFLVFLLLALTTTTAAHALAKSALADGIYPKGIDPEVVRAGLSEGLPGRQRIATDRARERVAPPASPQEDPPPQPSEEGRPPWA